MTDTYSILREFADSWALLALTAVFVGVILWAYRPGSRALHDQAATSILRDDTPPRVADCANACPDCTCASILEKLA
ncbi:Cbb3-type cytochrome oxidase component FixQ [Rhodobacteraceae bacterium THAF1]|uniref:cbb3-type cytochrome c oxidase subunit 3 n=1 Tax=Palleronia sp. THAF1 TaxID=2587842 RepID=UPI000F3C96FD|nr:cbb3-type cytochrome c oxidase subunit 3 [Palleronia sp. THAF1]QFU08803.1 Cbb3-type cytochrome oxidase component FixQ [Palleronia sp. THAF1]VDC23938.1 Cbb3-type cytochrome oxidase component FixQ [Rhodobacteraceae bacterium THAF1]